MRARVLGVFLLFGLGLTGCLPRALPLPAPLRGTLEAYWATVQADIQTPWAGYLATLTAMPTPFQPKPPTLIVWPSPWFPSPTPTLSPTPIILLQTSTFSPAPTATVVLQPSWTPTLPPPSGPSPTVSPVPFGVGATPTLTATPRVTAPSPTATNPSPTPTEAPWTPTPEPPTATPVPPSPTPTWTATPVPPTPTPASACNPQGDAAFEAQVVDLINQERQARGLAPLQVHSALQTAARGHSQDMACNGFFGHTGSDGSTPWERALRAGYAPSYLGENLYMGSGGYNQPQAVVQSWLNSPGHRDIMLASEPVHIGVGYVFLSETGTGYVTAMFGRP